MGTLLGGGASAASDYVARLLHGVTLAHMHHLMVSGQGSFAKHMALGELYEGLQDAVDELAEAYIGCSGSPLKFAPGQFVIGADPAADVKALYVFAENGRKVMGDESHIQNLVDEICSVLSRALYKLTRLA